VDDIQIVDVDTGAVVAMEAVETPLTPPPDSATGPAIRLAEARRR
jgi:hypothetical protein